MNIRQIQSLIAVADTKSFSEAAQLMYTSVSQISKLVKGFEEELGQVFFERKKNSWDIYIVNERNEVKIYSGFSGSRSALVNSINRFYTTSFEHSSSNSLYFNLPQYFVLSRDGATLHPFTIKQERY